MLEEDEELLLALDFGTKKKKKKDKHPVLSSNIELSSNNNLTEETPPPYLYSELLERVFQSLNQTNIGQDFSRTSIPPPRLTKLGSKRVIWTNFQEFCESIKRNTDHIFQYMTAELCTECSINGTNQLIIKGRFVPTYIDSIMKKYIQRYVYCSSCHSLNTSLTKDSVSKLFFIRCGNCMCVHSVANIKQGYLAQTRSDRIAQRNK
jgi:translation initiation factor 2 subunit 2